MKFGFQRRGLIFGALFLGWLFAGAAPSSVCAAAGSTEESLARYIPADVGLCVEADGLHAKLESFLDGPLYKRWRAYPPLAVWHAEQNVHLEKLDAVLKSKLGVSWQALRSQLFGRQWALAVYPPLSVDDAKRRRAPDGFVVLRAADSLVLEKAAEKLLEAKRADGDYIGESTLRFGGKSFIVHELKADDNRIFIARDGDFGCLATNFDKLKQVFALYAGEASEEVAAAGGALAARSEYSAAQQRLAPAVAVRAFVPTRSWIPYYESLSASSSDGSRRDFERFVEFWTTLESLSAALELGSVTRLSLQASWSPAGLPKDVRDQIAALTGGRDAAATIPADSLAVVSAQLDMKKIAGLVMQFAQAEADRREKPLPTEAKLAARLAGGFGPGFVAYLTPARRAAGVDEAASAGGGLPVDWVVGLETRPLQPGEPDLATVLEPLIRVGFVLAAEAHNAEKKPTAGVVTEQVDDMQITGLTGLGGPADLGVFVGHHGERLWWGAAPEALAEAVKVDPKNSLGQSKLYRLMHDSRAGTVNQFVFLNFGGLRAAVGSLSTTPPVWLADLKKPAARGGVRELQALLSLADAALLEATIDGTGASAALALGIAE